MKTYVRIVDRTVVEIVTTPMEIVSLYHPSLHWVDVTETPVQVNWVQGDDGTFTPPPPPPPLPLAEPTLSPSLTELLAEVATLKAQVAQLNVK